MATDACWILFVIVVRVCFRVCSVLFGCLMICKCEILAAEVAYSYGVDKIRTLRALPRPEVS